jgi:hypothetical protein
MRTEKDNVVSSSATHEGLAGRLVGGWWRGGTEGATVGERHRGQWSSVLEKLVFGFGAWLAGPLRWRRKRGDVDSEDIVQSRDGLILKRP